MSWPTTTTTGISLELWEKLEIIVERGNRRGLYITRVEDINDECILVSQPSLVEGYHLLTENSMVYLQYLRADALYRIRARMSTPKNSHGSQVEFTDFGAIHRVQRREFVRVDLKLGLKYCVIKSENVLLKNNDVFWYDSHTLNVSAGGMLMKVHEEVKVDDIVMIRIAECARIGIPRLVSAVCCRVTDINQRKYAGVQFLTDDKLKKYFITKELQQIPPQVTRFTSRAQNSMVNFVFEEQIKKRQKGLL